MNLDLVAYAMTAIGAVLIVAALFQGRRELRRRRKWRDRPNLPSFIHKD
jgi:hypothetical protein